MLSQAMYWSKRTKRDEEGWFYKTGEQWEEETGMSRFEQEGARKVLRKFSFWKEERRGVPAKMHYRVDITALSEELLRNAASPDEKVNNNARLLKTSKLECGNSANKNAENQQSSLRETSEHNNGVTETTTETIKTTTPLTPLVPGSDRSGETGRGRIFVEKILSGTLLASADAGRIAAAAEKYARDSQDIALVVDVLDQQYRQSKRKIDDQTAIVIAALKDGIAPPECYVPKAEREAAEEAQREATRNKNEQAQKAEEEEKQAYAEAEFRFTNLSGKDREDLLSEARESVHKSLRSSKKAIKSMALQIIIAKARAPDGKNNPR